MDAFRQFENWRDEIYCGGYEEPERWVEAEIGAKYEEYDYVYGRVVRTITCTEKNKAMIKNNLNDHNNDIWGYRKAKIA